MLGDESCYCTGSSSGRWGREESCTGPESGWWWKGALSHSAWPMLSQSGRGMQDTGIIVEPMEMSSWKNIIEIFLESRGTLKE